MPDTAEPRAVPPCHRVRAGKPPPMAFPSDPWTRSDLSRRVDPPADVPPPRANPVRVPRRRDAGPSPVLVMLAGVIVLCIVLPATLHLWRGVVA